MSYPSSYPSMHNAFCFSCRIAIRYPSHTDPPKCQRCQGPLVASGYKFRAPKSTNKYKWKKFKEFVRNFNPYYANQIKIWEEYIKAKKQ